MRLLLGILVASFAGVVSAQTVINTFPYTQDWEGESQGSTAGGGSYTVAAPGWANAANGTVDDLDWTADQNGTSSSTTGPSDDHTTPTTAGGFYLYVETSGGAGSIGNEAILTSPIFDASALTTPKAVFFYHAYGSNMGDLHIDVNEVFNTGSDGANTGASFTSATATFDASHVGSTIEIIGGGNAGLYTVTAVNSATNVTLNTAPAGGDLTGMSYTHYEVHSDVITAITDNQNLWQLAVVDINTTVTFTGNGSLASHLQMVFRYECTANGFWADMAIDDFAFGDLPDDDVGVSAITAPSIGLGLTATEAVTVSITNYGLAAQSNIPVQFTVDAGTPVSEVFAGPLAPGATATYTFTGTADLSTVGQTYTIAAQTNLTGDADANNDDASKQVRHVNTTPITTFPYSEDFEGAGGNWYPLGTTTTWELATPANTVINSANSGTNAWVTNATGNYINNEDGAVYSPPMDLTSVTDPYISLATFVEAEFSWDGAVLQTSIDSGASWQLVGALNDPVNWYNDNTISGLNGPTGQQVGWTGRNGSAGSGVWRTSIHALTGLAGQSDVRIRIVFGSDGSVTDEGFAFDDVWVGERTDLPEINVKIGSTDVANNTAVTGQGIATAGSNLNFSIENLGQKALTLTDQNPTNGDYVTVVGTAPNNIDTVTVTTQPGASVANGTPEGFVINVLPLAAGPYSFDVTIQSDDLAQNIATGTDGDLVAGTSTFTSATAAFTAAHVGTTITISGSGSGNDGTYVIATVVSATEATLTTAPAADESTLNWSHDDDESTYTFTVSGNAVANQSPVVSIPGTGSNFTSPSSNQFDLVLNPGATIADVLSVSDPEGDSMTVTVVAPGTPLTTLTTEPTTNGTPTAGPFTLDWAGTVDGSNAPGDFDWTITISDGISTDTVITARITVNDVAPTHAIGPDATTGDGLLSTTGYQATLAVGATTGVALAQINDANTGQSMTLGTVTPDGGNPTAAFTITVNGSNQIVATPTAALVPADVGFHTFDVQVGDGTNNINVFVTVGVEQAPSITSTAPTTAIVGVPYTYTVTADGVPAPTFSVSGLPAWLTFDGTATISGIPAAGDVGTTGNITITATNGVTPDDTEVFAITVSANATPTVTVTENGNPVTAGQTLTVATNDPISGLTLVFTGTDADAGDTVTLSSVVTNNGNITGFTQSEWDNATGANPVTATPNAGTVDVDGLMQVTVTATDNNGASSNFSFFILLPVAGNTAPAVALTGTSTLTGNQASGFALSINENTALSLADLVITDPDGDNIDVLSVSGTAAGVTAPTTSTGNTSPLTISWTGTPTTAGTYVFDVTITDNNTAPVVFQVTITVNGPKKKKKDGGGGDDGGCAATSTGGSAPFWALLLLTLGGLVAYRRRRNA